MKLSPYIQYKPSGVEWLGDVPGHWEVRRLKHLCSQSALYGANISANFYTDKGFRFLRTTDITDGGCLKKGGVFISKNLVGDYLLNDGDLLISRSGTIGRSFLYDSGLHGACSYAGYLVRFVPAPDVLPKYLFFFTKTQAFASFIKIMAILSTIENVNGEKYSNTHIPLPPLPEQTAIARFLDYKTQRIQQYIDAKQKLVALLKEQKQAIIQRAITRGLNPDVRLKPSGVEWLGDVPEHWEIRRFRTLSMMRVSNVDKHSKENEKSIRLCNYVDVYKNDHISKDMEFMRATATPDEIDRFQLKIDDVLITKDSETPYDIGVPALVVQTSDDLISGYHLALLRPFKNLLCGSYLFYTLNNQLIAYQFHVEAKGVTRYGLSHNAIKSVWIPLPPLPEQTAIANYLDKKTADIDATINRANRQIELMQEYRTRLISDVVTGKVDVRAINVPEISGDDANNPADSNNVMNGG